MRTIRLAVPALTALLFSTFVPGCDGCAEPPAGVDGGPNSLPPNGEPGDGNDGGPNNPGDKKRTLTFNGTSPIDLFYGDTAQLAFRLTDGQGANVSGDTVRFTTTGSAGQLNVSEAITDGSGLARVTFTAGTTEGDVTVTADADDVDNPESVTLRVRVNPYGTLRITVASQTRIPVARAEVTVWRGAANAVPTCAELAADDTPPTATFSAEYTQLPSTQTFNQQAQGTVVTARAVGFNQNGIAIADACTDGTAIVGGGTASTTLSLVQWPTQLDGDYDVRMQIDLGNALPEPYETYVDTVSSVLADPAGFAVYHALRQSDEQTGYTSFVYWDHDANAGTPDVIATYDDVAAHPEIFNTWRDARLYLDDVFRNQLGASRYDAITTVGGDVRGALTEFEVGSRFTLTPTPNTESGYGIAERWQDIVLRWRYGCAAGDLGCARRHLPLDGTNYAPVTSNYNSVAALAATPTETERFAIATEPHLFSLRYGAIVLLTMNELVFPSLSNGQANDIESMLNYLVDCVVVGEEIEWQTGGLISAQSGTTFCTNALALVANAVEDRVLQAQIGGGDPQLDPKEQEGALGGGTFYLIDQSHDLVADTVSEMNILVQWNDPENESGPSEDISAPILGEGRRAATGCDDDSACEAGFFCAPVPHYLKVSAVEMTCARPVGDTLGEESCTADDQCTTGLCVGASAGTPGTCFSACTSDTACGLGTCVADGATVGLDDVLAGLGSVSLASCLVD